MQQIAIKITRIVQEREIPMILYGTLDEQGNFHFTPMGEKQEQIIPNAQNLVVKFPNLKAPSNFIQPETMTA